MCTSRLMEDSMLVHVSLPLLELAVNSQFKQFLSLKVCLVFAAFMPPGLISCWQKKTMVPKQLCNKLKF